MALGQKLRVFVVEEPVVSVSFLLAGLGYFLPAVVRPILDSYGSSKPSPQHTLSDVVVGMTSKK